jgi:hypothetical protein
MAHDIRKMMGEQKETPRLSPGHEARFEAKLNQAFPQEKKVSEQKSNNTFFWLKVAALVVVFFGIGFFGYQQLSNTGTNTLADTPMETDSVDGSEVAQITLGDLSPDLKRVENFYLAGINAQLASIEPDDENKELIDGYMQRLSELDMEYKLLNKELNEVGPTEATISALIDNLKLRLELLFKLKNKLKELKNLENEQFNNLEA